jgi:hypothetical protein
MAQTQVRTNAVTMADIAAWWEALSEKTRCDYLAQLKVNDSIWWEDMKKNTHQIIFNAYRRWSATCE